MIENPPRTSLVSGYGPSVTTPSVPTTLAAWLCRPPPKTQTPASLAASTTLIVAAITSGSSSSVNVIQPSSNEIRYCVIPLLLVWAASGGRLSCLLRMGRADYDSRRRQVSQVREAAGALTGSSAPDDRLALESGRVWLAPATWLGHCIGLINAWVALVEILR